MKPLQQPWSIRRVNSVFLCVPCGECFQELRGCQRVDSDRHANLNGSASVAGVDFQGPTELPQSLSHSADAHSRRSIRGDFVKLLGSHARTVILHLQAKLAAGVQQADLCRLTSGMTMNVSKTFLNRSKDRRLYLGLNPSEVFGDLQLNLYPATLGV